MAAALRAHALLREYDASYGPLPIAGARRIADDAAHLAQVSQQLQPRE